MELTSEMLLDSRWYEIIISKSGSSQLLDEDRILFIKKICNNNVYLAALCKANSFGHTYMCLDEIITDKAVDNALLFPGTSKQKVDWFNLQDLHVPSVCGIDDSVCDFFHRKIILQGLVFLSLFPGNGF